MHSPEKTGTTTINRDSLTILQRTMFEENKARIAEHEQVLTPDFDSYERSYIAEVQDFISLSSISRLMDTIRTARVTLLGDYHTLPISQKSFLKLARKINRSRVIIGLELFSAENQKALDAYVLKGGAERTLLRNSKVIQQWPYRIWEHFKPILELARQRGWRVIGLDAPRNTQTKLLERDQFMAERILDGFEGLHPDTIMLALVGEMHVAGPHLPKAIHDAEIQRDQKPSQTLSIFQNPGPIYWKLVESNQEQETELVKIDEFQYALNSAPPIVVQQSYLNWIDYNVSTLDYDHLTRHFRKVAQNIEKALSLSPQSSVSQIHAYGPGDYSFLDDLHLSDSSDQSEQIQFANGKEASHVFLKDKVVYLSNLNINHVGEVAGRLIHSLAMGIDPSEMKPFYCRVMHNAIAFFASKVVNPKRKAHQLPYFRNLLKNVGTGIPVDVMELEVASAVLIHKQFELGKRSRAYRRLFASREESLSVLVQELGFMLGEKLYYSFMRGRFTRNDIRNLVCFPLSHPGQSAALYFSVSRQVDRERIPTRM